MCEGRTHGNLDALLLRYIQRELHSVCEAATYVQTIKVFADFKHELFRPLATLREAVFWPVGLR